MNYKKFSFAYSRNGITGLLNVLFGKLGLKFRIKSALDLRIKWIGDYIKKSTNNIVYSGLYKGMKIDESDDWIQHAIKRPGALHRELGVPEDEDIPKWKMDDAEDRLEAEKRRDHRAGRDMSAADGRELRQIDLAKTLEKFTENKASKKKSVNENLRRKRKNVRRK